MVNALNLPVNFIFLSDHGMANVSEANGMALPKEIDTTKFIVDGSETMLHVYAKNREDILPLYEQLKNTEEHFKAYLADSVPTKWHYSKQDDVYNRIGDIILVPKFPFIFNLYNRKIAGGKHGFDNYMTEMHATFLCMGAGV